MSKYKFTYSKKSVFKTPATTTYLITSIDGLAKFSLKADEFELAELFNGERLETEVLTLYQKAQPDFSETDLDEFTERLINVHLLEEIDDDDDDEIEEIGEMEENEPLEVEKIKPTTLKTTPKTPTPRTTRKITPKTKNKSSSQGELSDIFPELFNISPEENKPAKKQTPQKPLKPSTHKKTPSKSSKPKIQVSSIESTDIDAASDPVVIGETIPAQRNNKAKTSDRVKVKKVRPKNKTQNAMLSDGLDMEGMEGLDNIEMNNDMPGMEDDNVIEGTIVAEERYESPRRVAPPPKEKAHVNIVMSVPIGFMLPIGRFFLIPQINKTTIGISIFVIVLLLFGVSEVLAKFIGDIIYTQEGHTILFNLVLSMFTVNFFSQLARAAAIEKLTGKRPLFGIILLFYILPRFYTDMGGSLKALKENSQRFQVIGATLSALAMLFFLSILFWTMGQGSETVFSQTMPLISLMCVILFLLHINPLGLNEGYFLLALKVGALDLREQAIKTFFGKNEKKSRIPPSVLGLYGMFIIAFTLTIIYFVVTFIGGMLESELDPEGVKGFTIILSTGLMVAVIVKMIKLASKDNKIQANHPGGATFHSLQNRKNLPAQSNGFQSPFASNNSPRKKRRTIKEQASFDKKKSVLKLAVFLSVLGILGMQPYTYEPGGEVELIPREKKNVVSKIPATIQRIYVKEGDEVTQGQLIGKLSDEEEQKNVSISKSKIRSLISKLKIAKEGASPEEIARGMSRVKTAKTSYLFAKNEADRLYKLYKKRIIPQSQYDAAKAKAEVEHDKLETAKLDLKVLQTRVRPEEIESIYAEIDKEKANLRYYLKQLEYTKMYAPIDGRVTRATSDITYSVGQFIQQGEPLLAVEDNRELFANIWVSQTAINVIKKEQAVKIRIYTYSNDEFYGEVDEIGQVIEERPNGKKVRIRSIIDNTDNRLKSGLTGRAKIVTPTKPAFIVFTSIIVRFVKVTLWGIVF